ncbi:hypothetical protein F5884DRAFT_273979 [Xylogone sp. PMI_703]|nr:hypothetical protein F5884DRAFT_273979 [Xylogone sp. PMI_703]
MTSVYQTMRIDARFGDIKTIDSALNPGNKKGDIPDICILTERGALRIVGEAKTPWMHDVTRQLLRLQRDQYEFRNYIGQIARYMYTFKVKYGFWTNYDETVFFKQEPHPEKKGKYVLWHSNVISTETSTILLEGRSQEPRSYHGKVSLRECFHFLGQKIKSGEFGASYPMDYFKEWVSPNPDDYSRPFSSDLYITDDPKVISRSTGGHTASPRGVEALRGGDRDRISPRRDDANRPATRSQSRLQEELVERTAGLTISERSRSATPTRPVIVHQDRRGWYYQDRNGQSVYVDLQPDSESADRRYYYIARGVRYEAQIYEEPREHGRRR